MSERSSIQKQARRFFHAEASLPFVKQYYQGIVDLVIGQAAHAAAAADGDPAVSVIDRQFTAGTGPVHAGAIEDVAHLVHDITLPGKKRS